MLPQLSDNEIGAADDKLSENQDDRDESQSLGRFAYDANVPE